MTKYDFKTISIRGRVAFGISCLSAYISNKYPDADFSPVIDLACKITEDSDYIDISTMTFMEIVPEYLYEFDNYADAEFEYLTEEQYLAFTNLIPKDDADLNDIMLSIQKIAWEYSYVAVEPWAPETYPYISTLIDTMNKNALSLPTLEKYLQFVFDENDGWGRFIKREEYM